MTDLHAWSVIAVIALVTILLRFLPFVIFSSSRKTPPIIEKLGRILPYAIMGMLVVYCLKDLNFSTTAAYLPAIIASLTVAALHVWKRSTLLSILGGTICYMLLVQFIF